MSPNRRAVLLTGGAVIAGTTGAVAKTRSRSSGAAPERSRPSNPDVGLEGADQRSSAAVTGTWSAYKHDAANTGYAPGTTGPRGSVRAMWSKSFDQAVYSTPAVVDGRVFVGTYSYGAHAGSVRAFDAATGQRLWRVRTGRIHASAPTVADGTLYVNSGGLDNPELVHALDAATGETVWTHEFEGGEHIRSSPTVSDGVVYATAGIGTDAKGVTNVAVRAIDATTGERLWSVTVEKTALGYSSPAVVEGTVYNHFVDEGGTGQELLAFDAATGETEWSVDGCSITGSPTVVDGTLYHSATAINGGVVARDAATGELLWEVRRDTAATFGPAVADGTVYATTTHPGSVFAVDAGNGEVQWEVETDETRGSPVVDSDTVYVPGWNAERIYALDADGGTKRWHFDLESSPYQPPAVVDGTLFVGDAGRDGGLYAVTGR